MVSKLVEAISTLLASLIQILWSCIKVIQRKIRSNASNSEPASGPQAVQDSEFDRTSYVLHLEDEKELSRWIISRNDPIDSLIKMGRDQQSKILLELLEKSAGFKGVAAFDSSRVPSLVSHEPDNCWRLVVGTLTSIIWALPNVEMQELRQLTNAVSKGLFYVSQVEEVLYTKKDVSNIKSAAERVWLNINFNHGKWLDNDLQKMASEHKTSKETLKKLVDMAKNWVIDFKTNGGILVDNPSDWPENCVAANSMYRICQTILLYLENNQETDDILFKRLSSIIADILCACFTNLPRVITMKCSGSAIEKREENVRDAALLLGETEEVIKFLHQQLLPPLTTDEMMYIDDWRAALTRNINSKKDSVRSGSRLGRSLSSKI